MSERPKIVLVNRCFVKNDANRFLLLKRSLGDRHNPGLWEAPGGKLEEGEDIRSALEAEVMQEAGLLVEPTERAVYADSTVIGSGKYVGHTYLVLFGIARIVGGVLKLSHEHEAHAWVTYEESLDYELTPETRKAAILMEKNLRAVLLRV